MPYGSNELPRTNSIQKSVDRLMVGTSRVLLQIPLPIDWPTFILLTIITLSVIPHSSHSLPRSEENAVSKYLYYDFSATVASQSSQFVPIQEYVIHTAPGEDFEKIDMESDWQDHHDHVIPYFLRPGDDKHVNRPRVVQFYSPFVGDCITFRPKYVTLARELNSRLDAGGPPVDFHALSCSEFRKVCRDQNILSYPTIKVFKAYSSQGIQIYPNGEADITAEDIATSLGISLKDNKSVLESKQNDAAADSNFHISPHKLHHHDALGAMQKAKAHTQKHSFIDAALSCTFAFENAIYPPSTSFSSDSKPLSLDRKVAFQEWIDLLYWTLPPIWKIHILINDIRTHFDAATISKRHLVQMVKTHHDVIHEHEENRQWTTSCRRPPKRPDHKSDVSANQISSPERSTEEAYLCGFWNLLHIVSIGVSERHKAVLGQRDRVSTAHAAETIRNYVDKFIACEACRHYFLEVYDKCGFNLCKRLKQPKNSYINSKSNNGNHPRGPSEASWYELALWLWELHNDVNVKLLREKEMAAKRTPSRMQEDASRWPSRESCPKCWRDDGSWDSDAVYEHLKYEYWPRGPQHFRYVVLGKKVTNTEEHSSLWVQLEYILFRRYGLVVLVIIAYLTSVVYQQRQLDEVGRRKKFDRNGDIRV